MKYVPMLHNFAVFVEAKNIYPCIILISRPLLMAMQHNEVTLGNYSFEVNLLFGEFRVQSLEVLDESILTITDVGIVLDVFVANVLLDGLAWLTSIKH